MNGGRYGGSAVVWALLLAYASLYPFYPMRAPAPDALNVAFSLARQVIRSDVAFNVVAYMPLGTLLCLYFRQRGGRGWAIPRAVGIAAAFSLAMEVVQLFIPNRVSSVVDLASNAGGALLGALVFADPFYSMVTRPLGALRERVVIGGPWGDAALVLVMLWLLAQLNPALPFFGAGDIGADSAGDGLLQWVAVGMGTCGFGLFVSSVTYTAPFRITLVLLTVALWLNFLFAALILQPHFSADWVSTARLLALVGGLAAFFPLRHIPRPWQIYGGFVLVLAGALLSKIVGAWSPLDEFLRLFRWPHGQLGSFATLTRFLHELWPFAAVVYLIALFLAVRRAPPAARMAP
jgi:VanZ family protein